MNVILYVLGVCENLCYMLGRALMGGGYLCREWYAFGVVRRDCRGLS